MEPSESLQRPFHSSGDPRSSRAQRTRIGTLPSICIFMKNLTRTRSAACKAQSRMFPGSGSLSTNDASLRPASGPLQHSDDKRRSGGRFDRNYQRRSGGHTRQHQQSRIPGGRHGS